MTVVAYKDGVLVTDSLFIDVEKNLFEYRDDAKVLRVDGYGYVGAAGACVYDKPYEEIYRTLFWSVISESRENSPQYTDIELSGYESDQIDEMPSRFLIVTKRKVFEVSIRIDGENKIRVIDVREVPLDKDNFVFTFGTSSEETRGFLALGYDLIAAVDHAIKFSTHSGGNLHVYKQSNLKVLPKTTTKKRREK